MNPVSSPETAENPLPARWLGSVDYQHGLDLQVQLHGAISNGSEPEQILHLEHLPVFTIGRTQDQSSLRASTALPHPVHVISRGGQATYHGPGQLVSYPLVNLGQRGRDLHAYLRALEEALIRTCHGLGVPAQRRDGLTGIWVENRKLASIGVGVRRWITLHGLAINITREALSGFDWITPCGLDGVSMTSLDQEGAPCLTPQKFAELLHPQLVGEITALGVSSSRLSHHGAS